MRVSTPETSNLSSEAQVVSAEPAGWQSLGALPDGAAGWVRQLGGGREFAGRMAALGFTLGVNVTVIRRVDGGPLIVEVRDTRVALGHDEADLVFVEGGQRTRELPSPSMTIAPLTVKATPGFTTTLTPTPTLTPSPTESATYTAGESRARRSLWTVLTLRFPKASLFSSPAPTAPENRPFFTACPACFGR